jgi:CHAT domain-containing protein
MIHLATHAIVDENQPLYSRIVFAQDDDPNEDGFLQTYEIFDLDLDADLVTLSACETGLGKLSRSEGFVGITRAFMYAGARSLLVSLWSVDESTALLMNEFYKNLKKGQGKSEALRNAKLHVLNSKTTLPGGVEVSLAHPFYWAPFVLFGNFN